MPEAKSLLDGLQVIGVVVGLVLSVFSFNAARKKEAEARKLEAAKPFYELRQKLYTDVVKTAATLANPSTHTAEEIEVARKRFRALYVAELSMVEASGVERKMMELASQVDPELLTFTPAQNAAYDLAHALRDSFAFDWQLPDDKVLGRAAPRDLQAAKKV